MKKVAAIVVTYNRLELLKRCIVALRNQNYQDFDIVIVNNGSTDGTREWIDAQDDIIVINQENCGGAGGFHTGQKYAYDNGYDWIWMMDDDGVAAKDELENLVNVCSEEEIMYANALVANIENPNVLAFHPEVQVSEVKGNSTTQYFSPFNGTIIHRKLIDRIGLIKREMFIWGDETEYSLRARRAGHQGKTITNALHLHPQNKGVTKKALPPFAFSVVVKPKHFSKYYYRNRGYIEKQYSTLKVRICSYIVYSLFFIRGFDFKELLKFWKYYTDGVKNRY